MLDGVRQERRVPEAEQDAGCEPRLPAIVGRDDLVHEREQPRRVVLHLHVDVEFDVRVLGLWRVKMSSRGISDAGLTLNSRAIVSAKVGMP